MFVTFKYINSLLCIKTEKIIFKQVIITITTVINIRPKSIIFYTYYQSPFFYI